MKQFSPVPILEITVHKLAARTWRNCRAHTHELCSLLSLIQHTQHMHSHTSLTHTCGEDLIKFSTVIGGADNWTICQGTIILFATAEAIAHQRQAFRLYIFIAHRQHFLRPARISFWLWELSCLSDVCVFEPPLSTSEMGMINKICTTMLHWKGSSRWLWNYPSISASLSALSRRARMQITMVL